MKNFCPPISETTERSEISKERSQDRAGHGAQAYSLCGQQASGLFPKQTKSIDRPRGWILYDGDCPACRAGAKRFKHVFARRSFEFLPLQTPWVQERLGLTPSQPIEEMQVLTKEGRHFGGADAIIFLARQVWWARPLALLADLPGIRSILRSLYRWIAAHRGCTHIACRTKERRLPSRRLKKTAVGRPPLLESAGALPRLEEWPGWTPLLVFPTFALLARSHVAPWIFMWLVAGGIFLGCKWLTFWRARSKVDAGIGRSLGYLFAWPGMDAASFLGPRQKVREPFLVRGCWAAAKVVAGTLLLFWFARLAPGPLLAGWIGMIGMILILHFGLFELTALAWRITGVKAKPIMNAPAKATSLSEFWGRRWNGAFNQLVVNTFFRPLTHSIGTVRATLTAFLLSGLLHELVISLPARAGYGLPTAYFLMQGWGVVSQHTPVAKRLGFDRGLRGWIFTMLIAAGPAFWLFHPPFVRNVIIPFMKAIGAL